MIFVDSHCHIDGEAFDADRNEVVKRANEAGVKLCSISERVSLITGVLNAQFEIAEKYENVYASIGIHPHDAKTF